MNAKQLYKMNHAHLRRMLNAGKSMTWLDVTLSGQSRREHEALKAAQLAIKSTGRQTAPTHDHRLAFENAYGPNGTVARGRP